MPRLPRLAVGSVQLGVDLQPMLWGLMEALTRCGVQVQSFLWRACFPRHPAAANITGADARHLDSWLMSPTICRVAFIRHAQESDLALVEGRFEEEGAAEGGGRLEPLCQWLDLPRLAVLDAAQLRHCRLGPRPADAAGLLVDRVSGEEDLARLSTDLEALWGLPVLGALDAATALRERVASIPRGDAVPRAVCQAFGDRFLRFWKPRQLLAIAARRPMPSVAGPQAAPASTPPRRLRVAVAYDEAFRCYFPDTLDLLERGGATLVDFSPLHDEALPPGTDVVYLGCGHPERYADALADNCCIQAALLRHVRLGGRVYAEGGGAAYLCQQLQAVDGRLVRMAGVLPASARLAATPVPPHAAVRTLNRPTWLGPAGTVLRGYRNGDWRFEPLGPGVGLAAEADGRCDLVGNGRAVGSLLHVDFALQPGAVQRFFAPRPQDAGPAGRRPAAV